MIGQLESHAAHLITFLSLPRELRQQILFYTFHDAHLADLGHNYETRGGVRDPVLETPNMSAWARDLISTHPTISADVNFVAGQWTIIVINGWRDFCKAKLVKRVEEAVERVREKFRLMDEQNERAYLSLLARNAERFAVTG